MDGLLLNNILTGFLILASVYVGYILQQQIKSQKDKIENLEKISSIMRQYTDIFDFDRLKKYVQTEKELMNQDLEVLRRETIKKTTKETTEFIRKNIDERIDKTTAPLWNDLSIFSYWFFNTPKDGNMEDHIKAMFPNSHKQLLDYFQYLEKTGLIDHIEKPIVDKSKKS
ncbi:hypothetical protein [Mariniflexile sp.]|uniref:hypothetical protein n=1 Tax=Mariniflexile sp. TaxID=1979402 RepID=UPI004047731E